MSIIILLLTLFLSIRDGVLDPTYRDRFLLKYIPHLEWQWWLVIGMFFLLLLTLEGTYRAYTNNYVKLLAKHKARLKEVRTEARLTGIHAQTTALLTKEHAQSQSVAVPSTAEVRENEFSDLRVTADLKREIYIEIWCVYNGEFGEDAVHVDLEPLNNGQPLFGHRDTLTMQKPIAVIGHKVLLKGVYYTYVPDNVFPEPEESTHLQVCMVHQTKGVFHRQTFPYKKVWE